MDSELNQIQQLIREKLNFTLDWLFLINLVNVLLKLHNMLDALNLNPLRQLNTPVKVIAPSFLIIITL